jgi:hypothetical protein
VRTFCKTSAIFRNLEMRTEPNTYGYTLHAGEALAERRFRERGRVFPCVIITLPKWVRSWMVRGIGREPLLSTRILPSTMAVIPSPWGPDTHCLFAAMDRPFIRNHLETPPRKHSHGPPPD